MKVNPYVSFNGNCGEAVMFYEKVFNTKAQIMRYKDAPPDSGYAVSADVGDLVMHSQIELGGESLMFCDAPPEYPVTTGDNITIMVAFDDSDSAKAAFAALSDGGVVSMELQETFWSKCFGSLTDKFGISWHIEIGGN